MAYGLRIWNDANTLTLDTSTRPSILIVSGTASITTGSSPGAGSKYYGTSSSITCAGITAANTNEVNIFGPANGSGSFGAITFTMTYTRSTGSFTITIGTHQASTTYSIKYYAVRY